LFRRLFFAFRGFTVIAYGFCLKITSFLARVPLLKADSFGLDSSLIERELNYAGVQAVKIIDLFTNNQPDFAIHVQSVSALEE
jgi:hypothetical protein